MPKRSASEDKITQLRKKLRKLEEREFKKRRRIVVFTDSSSDDENLRK